MRGKAGSGHRADNTTKRFQGINVYFFGDIETAFELLEKEHDRDCNQGLSILRELSDCYDVIELSLLHLVKDVLKLNQPGPDKASFSFADQIKKAEAICQTKSEN